MEQITKAIFIVSSLFSELSSQMNFQVEADRNLIGISAGSHEY